MNKAGSSWVFDVTEKNFDEQVVQRSRLQPVVVDFWAPWCQPCLILGPLLEQLIEERGGQVVLAKVDVDQERRLAQAFGIHSIPAVKAFRDGGVLAEFTGLLPETHLRQFFDKILPSEADRLVKQAAGMAGTNPAEAEALYRHALELEPNHSAAALGLAKLLIARRQNEEARPLLERVRPVGDQATEVQQLEAVLFLREAAKPYPAEQELRQRVRAEPKNAALRLELGTVLAAEGHYSEALEMLLSAVERDRQLGAGPVREVMVKIFYAVGVRSPLADEYRQKLTGLLY
jgi:putative thioredoxin